MSVNFECLQVTLINLRVFRSTDDVFYVILLHNNSVLSNCEPSVMLNDRKLEIDDVAVNYLNWVGLKEGQR